MALTSSLPVNDRMEGARINLYVCLLAMVGAVKDTAIDRALGALGLNNEGAFYTEYSPNGDRAVATLLGEKPAKRGDDHPQPGFAPLHRHAGTRRHVAQGEERILFCAPNLATSLRQERQDFPGHEAEDD